ncbi:porin [Paraburkholderia haematera]|uniref:Outer membrane porin protein 32 n=1 Tax=Paraburkholderia haematera TaxID=2793077 RepID=A0ABM8SQA9_9BURK|nr:porin [Paraburkholderia haematera]CAE6825781.1 Outer membrane porin protein 32 [Paraburkholderia haematera]
MTENRRNLLTVPACVLLGSFGLSAHAQSSVTLYGIVDAGVLYTSRTLNPTTGQGAGHQFSLLTGGLTPSLFGLKGSEDLGGGMTAIFALESGIDTTNGGLNDSNGNFFGRQAWVGIAGNFGTVKAGVQLSPFVLSLISTDPRGASYFGSGVPLYTDNVFVTGAFNSNAISYASPTIAGFQGNALLALGGVAGNFQAGRQYSASLNYTYGQLLVSAAMYSGNAGGTAATTPVPSTVPFSGRTIGASYHFDNLTVKAVYVNYKVSGSFDSRVYGGGLSYQFTPATNVDAGVWYTSDGNDTNNHSILAAIGLTYSLSARTLLYSQFGVVDNHGKMNTGVSTNGALFGPAGTTLGTAIGIRHLF